MVHFGRRLWFLDVFPSSVGQTKIIRCIVVKILCFLNPSHAEFSILKLITITTCMTFRRRQLVSTFSSLLPPAWRSEDGNWSLPSHHYYHLHDVQKTATGLYLLITITACMTFRRRQLVSTFSSLLPPAWRSEDGNWSLPSHHYYRLHDVQKTATGLYLLITITTCMTYQKTATGLYLLITITTCMTFRRRQLVSTFSSLLPPDDVQKTATGLYLLITITACMTFRRRQLAFRRRQLVSTFSSLLPPAWRSEDGNWSLPSHHYYHLHDVQKTATGLYLLITITACMTFRRRQLVSTFSSLLPPAWRSEDGNWSLPSHHYYRLHDVQKTATGLYLLITITACMTFRRRQLVSTFSSLLPPAWRSEDGNWSLPSHHYYRLHDVQKTATGLYLLITITTCMTFRRRQLVSTFSSLLPPAWRSEDGNWSLPSHHYYRLHDVQKTATGLYLLITITACMTCRRRQLVSTFSSLLPPAWRSEDGNWSLPSHHYYHLHDVKRTATGLYLLITITTCMTFRRRQLVSTFSTVIDSLLFDAQNKNILIIYNNNIKYIRPLVIVEESWLRSLVIFVNVTWIRPLVIVEERWIGSLVMFLCGIKVDPTTDSCGGLVGCMWSPTLTMKSGFKLSAFLLLLLDLWKFCM